MKKKIKKIIANRKSFIVKSAFDTELTEIIQQAFIREYNIEGQLIAETNYDNSGEISEKYMYKYSGELLIEKITFYDQHEIAEHEIYEYSEGRIAKSTIQYNEGFEESYQYQYDSNGSLTQKINEDGGERIEYKREGNELIELHFDEDGKQVLSIKSIFNAQGQLIFKLQTDEESSRSYSWEYDLQNRITKETQINLATKEEYVMFYEYSTTGKIIKTRTIADDEESITTYEYDSMENEIGQIETNTDGDIKHKVIRKFDEDGNILETHVEYSENLMNQSDYSLFYEYEFYN